MAANGSAQAGVKYPDGHWGKWRGVECEEPGCTEPVSCKGVCRSHYNKRRWAEGYRPASTNAKARRAARIKHRYGITAQEYDAMVARQRGLCAICGEPPADGPAHWGGKLCIDHDHESGRVRELLCNDCNLIVKRHFTPERLRAAAEYLERHT